VTTTTVRSYLREDSMPHVLCPGCAHGIVLRSFIEAAIALGLDRDKLAMVAGIGCSSRLVGHVDACTLHTTHGRAPAFATGIKLARPELTVAVITGDGDGLAIGGNHLIHAARRNLDINVILFNNEIYGMTGGQLAPTMDVGDVASTAPYGNADAPFDPSALIAAAGAGFVARALAAEPVTLTGVFREAIEHPGFSFIEVISDCPTYYGRLNDAGDDWEMLASMKRQDPSVASLLASKRFVDHIARTPEVADRSMGVLQVNDRPEYGELYRSIAKVADPSPAGQVTDGSADGQAGVAAPGPHTDRAELVPPLEAAGSLSTNGHARTTGRRDVRVAGMGGQGVVMAGALLAEAALASGRHATHSQVYGPEARGGSSRSDVVIADSDIGFPLTEKLDLLVALSTESCLRFAPDLREGGTMIVDETSVADLPEGPFDVLALPIVATAQEVYGGLIGTGVIALGALVELSGAVEAQALERAVTDRFGDKHRETNLRGVAAGRRLVQEATGA